MTQHRARLGLLAAAVVVLAGCSNQPSSSTPPPPVLDSVTLPSPHQRGPTVTVAGRVSWLTTHPGCPQLLTAGGQRFHLTGAAAQDLGQRARTGGFTAQQRLQVTGYVPETADTNSVCGISPAFVLEKVVPTPQ
jgi:hypothetical protein